MKITVLRNSVYILLATLLLAACGEGEEGATTLNSATTDDSAIEPSPENAAHLTRIVLSENRTTPEASEFKTIEWDDLIPKDDLTSINLNDIEDGATEEQINRLIELSMAAGIDPFQNPIASTKSVGELNNQAVRIPGFIVPLEFNDDKAVTQFFLVPYFGACIHVPPPPPNQIVFVNYPKGLKIETTDDPFWISGVMKTALKEVDMATSAYSMEMDNYEEYAQ